MHRLSISIPSDSEDSISSLLVAMMGFSIITNCINAIVNLAFPNSPYDTLLCLLVLVVFILRALPTIIKRIDKTIIISLFIMMLLSFWAIINPNAQEYATRDISRCFLRVLPFFLIGHMVIDEKQIVEKLEKIAPGVILLSVVYYIIDIRSGYSIAEDNMAFSYYLLPFTCILLCSAIRRASVLKYVLVSAGFVVHVLTGTRGPILCFFACFVLAVIYTPYSLWKKALIIAFIALFSAFLISPLFLNSMKALSGYLYQIGIKNRIIEKILSAEFLEGSGRNMVHEKVLSAISEKPVLGYGFLGDRGFQNGGYPHNLFLELWVQFGVVIGSILVALVFYLFIKSFIMKKNVRELYMVVFASSIVKLMVSGSYIYEGMFFLLLGLTIKKHYLFENTES